jgi:hypothetical protein
MNEELNAHDFIVAVCRETMGEGITQWKAVRARIHERLSTLPETERRQFEQQLRLMVSLPEDQSHDVMRH